MGEVNRFNTREVCAYTPNYTAAFAVWKQIGKGYKLSRFVCLAAIANI